MMEYRIIELKGINEFEEEINGLIQGGWKPLGGVCVTNLAIKDGIDSWYAQAMIREIPEQH